MSANRFTFSTYSNDPEDGLPSYDELFNVKQFPTAQFLPSAPLLPSADFLASVPLLDYTFPSTVFGTTRIEFEYAGADNFGYYFVIRDSARRLKAKGKVVKLDVTIQNMSGVGILKIIQRDSVYERGVRTFGIYNKNVLIGNVKVAEKAPAESCLKVISKGINSKITVRSSKIDDVAIFRDNSSSTPLVNIQLPFIDAYNEHEFHGRIIFHPETGITADEQLLCTATAIAFRATMRKMSKYADTESKVSACSVAIIVILILLLLIILSLS